MTKTAFLLIGFGGPRGPKEVQPFLESVLKGVSLPPERFQEVLRHYEALGGVSHYNEETLAQKQALERWLAEKGASFQVGLAFRHSTPSLADGLEVFGKFGVKKVVGFVLSPFRCQASFGKYLAAMDEAKRVSGAGIDIVYTDEFFSHPLFIEAVAARIVETQRALDGDSKPFTVFTAHSIPVSMDEESGYSRQFQNTAALIARKLDLGDTWTVAYQSRSGSPRDAWLEPSVEAVIRTVDLEQFNRVLLVPIGFLCDNTEVMYDLDVDARRVAESRGLRYRRASTVKHHPKFIELMGTLLLEKSA